MLRLDSLVARNLGCSRAEARRILEDAAPHVEGGTPLRCNLEVDPGSLPLRLRTGDQIVTLYNAFHLMQNKPAGCITALRDGRHPVAYSLLQNVPLAGELRPVGRLDLETTGLLLWTTEGQWIQRLGHPKRQIPRTYQAVLARPFGPLPTTLALADGHRPAITHLAAIASEAELHPSLARPDNGHCYASITVLGGAYHEVRRIFAALGSHVLALCRVSFGRVTLPMDLAPGEYRAIRMDDV